MKIGFNTFSNNLLRAISLGLLLTITAGFIASCGEASSSNSVSSPGTPAESPTDAYKKLYAAVKSKDTEAIKAVISTKTQEFATMVSQKQNTPIEKVFENGFTSTTFAESLPEIRDERVSEGMASVEVYNSKDKRWEDLPFILEEGGWKLAIGDLFAGTHKSPGKGRAQKEEEAANVLTDRMTPVNANVNGNFSGGPRPAVPAEGNAAKPK